MTDNVKNIIDGINKTNKDIEEIQTEAIVEANYLALFGGGAIF